MNKALLQQALDALCKSFPTKGKYEEELEDKHRQAIQALRTELAKPEQTPVAVYRFSVPMQEYGVKWLITSELPDNTLLYVKEQL